MKPKHYKLVVFHWHDKGHHEMAHDEVFLLEEGKSIQERLAMRFGELKAREIIRDYYYRVHTHNADQITKFFIDRLSFYDHCLFDHLDIDYDRFYNNKEYDLVEKSPHHHMRPNDNNNGGN